MHAPAVARLDQELDVGIHERHGHCHGRPIGQDEARVSPELLDDAEDVVPASAIQTGTVVAQLEDDLVGGF